MDGLEKLLLSVHAWTLVMTFYFMFGSGQSSHTVACRNLKLMTRNIMRLWVNTVANVL